MVKGRRGGRHGRGPRWRSRSPRDRGGAAATSRCRARRRTPVSPPTKARDREAPMRILARRAAARFPSPLVDTFAQPCGLLDGQPSPCGRVETALAVSGRGLAVVSTLPSSAFALAVARPLPKTRVDARFDPPAGGGLGPLPGATDAMAAYRVGPTTSTVPAAVRALSSGRYMSSTVAAGAANVPGDTARRV